MEIVLFFIGCYLFYLFFFKNKKKDNNSPQIHKTDIFIDKTPSINFSFDDNFATFRISNGFNIEKSVNKNPGKWIKPNEKVIIKNITIDRGLFYFGGVLTSANGYSTESSLVDDKLKIKNSDINYIDDSLGYWPQFISISPKCRGAYINWLASDRSMKKTPIGYVFIYFYGLERRVLVDGQNYDVVDDNEYEELFNEIKRLRNIYNENRSFFNYSSRLIEFMCLSRPGIISIPESENGLLTCNNSLLFKYELATTVLKGNPITPELALMWLKNYPEYNLRTPARRCEDEFSNLFKIKFIEQFKDNFIVKPNKTKLKIEYRPASSSIHGIYIEQDLPDPSVLKGPVKKLIDIAEQCIKELEPYSRYLGKKGTSKKDVAALSLLPDKVESKQSSGILNKTKKICVDVISKKNGLISFKDFWSLTGEPLPEKVNKKENDIIIKFAQKAGFGIAPDYRFHSAKPSIDGDIVIFEGGHGEFFKPSIIFNVVGMVLRLGVMIARSDSNVDITELNLLKQQIDFNTNLSPIEKKSLHAYLDWRLNAPVDMAGLKKSLEKMNQEDKAALSKILINIALADGHIDPSEIKQLEKLYSALSLDKNLVTSDIHNLSSQISNINNIQSGKTSRNEVDSKFKLDKDILALHENETRDVQNILSSIFGDEANDILEEVNVEYSKISDNQLDSKHSSLYNTLISKEKWDRKEIEKFCNDLGIMVDGAIEVINDWSLERVDSPLIEDDEYIYIDKEIAEELVG